MVRILRAVVALYLLTALVGEAARGGRGVAVWVFAGLLVPPTRTLHLPLGFPLQAQIAQIPTPGRMCP